MPTHMAVSTCATHVFPLLLWVSGLKLEENVLSLNAMSQTLLPLRAFETTSAWTLDDHQPDVISCVRVQSAVKVCIKPGSLLVL